MPRINVNKALFQISQWTGYGLAFLMFSYFISGYGMTKAIIDPVLAKSLHEVWLPLPTVILFVLHVLFPLRIALRKRIEDANWVDIYLLVMALVILIIFLYLYFL